MLNVRIRADKTGPTPRRGSPWPVAGIDIVNEGGAAAVTRIAQGWVVKAEREGWVTLVNRREVERPGGPPDDPWRADKIHKFLQTDKIILHTADGDVTWVVTHQPDKYADPGDDSTPVTDEVYQSGATRVDYFYDVQVVE